jgi:hypothetical protein
MKKTYEKPISVIAIVDQAHIYTMTSGLESNRIAVDFKEFTFSN